MRIARALALFALMMFAPATLGAQVEPSVTSAAAAREQREEEIRQDEARDRKLGLWLTGFLAAVTLGTGFVVGWQALETKRTADAARVSADISERAFVLLNQPTLAVVGWRAVIHPGMAMGDSATIQAAFYVSNDSAVPALLSDVHYLTVFGDEPYQRLRASVEVSQLVTRSNPLPFSQDFSFAGAAPGQEARFYSDKGIEVSVVGRLAYTDAFCGPGEVRTATFGRLFWLAHPNREFITDVSLLPSDRLNALLLELDTTPPSPAS